MSYFKFRQLVALVLFCSGCSAVAQSYADRIAEFRKHYKDELLADDRAPVKKGQLKYLDFFPADSAYLVTAEFKRSTGAQPFMIPTHSGKQKPYQEYGLLTFRLKGALYTLHVYQGLDLIKNEQYKDYLFLPFTDRTNYQTTYGGGRYIDLSLKDIVDGRVQLDFNKCYNPYCAYADGFSCPIPPQENSLPVEIRAGEKSFRLSH